MQFVQRLLWQLEQCVSTARLYGPSRHWQQNHVVSLARFPEPPVVPSDDFRKPVDAVNQLRLPPREVFPDPD